MSTPLAYTFRSDILDVQSPSEWYVLCRREFGNSTFESPTSAFVVASRISADHIPYSFTIAVPDVPDLLGPLNREHGDGA